MLYHVIIDNCSIHIFVCLDNDIKNIDKNHSMLVTPYNFNCTQLNKHYSYFIHHYSLFEYQGHLNFRRY